MLKLNQAQTLKADKICNLFVLMIFLMLQKMAFKTQLKKIWFLEFIKFIYNAKMCIGLMQHLK
jgi:hypothetical protein